MHLLFFLEDSGFLKPKAVCWWNFRSTWPHQHRHCFLKYSLKHHQTWTRKGHPELPWVHTCNMSFAIELDKMSSTKTRYLPATSTIISYKMWLGTGGHGSFLTIIQSHQDSGKKNVSPWHDDAGFIIQKSRRRFFSSTSNEMDYQKQTSNKMDISEYAAIWALIYKFKQHVLWHELMIHMGMWWNMKLRLFYSVTTVPYDMFVICKGLLC